MATLGVELVDIEWTGGTLRVVVDQSGGITTGQLAEVGAPQPISYADLTDPVKLILGVAMVVGRLETLALLALVLPGKGRR